jgi:hypothetical protein
MLLADRVKESTTTTGTGAITLLGAANQYRSFATAFGVSSVKNVMYSIVGQTGSEWEVGIGTFNGTTGLTRDTVIASSNSNALVNFSAGVKDVFCDLSASLATSVTNQVHSRQGTNQIACGGETSPVTVTSASPGVITWANHNFEVGTPMYIAGGTPPSGMNSSATYYILSVLSANTFTLGAFPGGGQINTSSTGTSVVMRSGNRAGGGTISPIVLYTPGGAANTLTTNNVSASRPWVITASGGFDAFGFPVNRIARLISNQVWTFGGDGNYYLYFDVAADGSVTTGSTTTAPEYDGLFRTTSGAYTFSPAAMIGTLGNGTGYSQVYRTFVGEAQILGGSPVTVNWYQPNGYWESDWINTLPSASTAISFTHYLGMYPSTTALILECLTTDGGYAVGDRLLAGYLTGAYASSLDIDVQIWASRNSIGFSTNAANQWAIKSKTAAGNTALTAANWRYKMVAMRGWNGQ